MSSGGGSGGGAICGQPIEGADEPQRDRGPAHRSAGRPASAAAWAATGLAAEEPDPPDRLPRQGAGRRPGTPGRAGAARAARPRGRCLRRGAPVGSVGSVRRGSIARLLIRISWLAIATNELTLPSRSAVSRLSASRYASASAAERDRQDVELARLDERQEERQRAVELGHLDLRPALRTAAFAEADGRRDRDGGRGADVAELLGGGHDRDARALLPVASVGLVGEPQQLAELRRRAARPGCGSARRSVASSPRPRPARRTSRRACAAAPARGGTRGARSPRAGSRRRSGSRGCTPRAARRRCRPCRRRAAARRRAGPAR